MASGRIAGWARTGLSFKTYAAGDSRLAGAAPVCRPITTPASPVYYAVIARNGAGAAPKAGIAVEWKGSGGGGGTTPPPTANTPICTIDASPPSPSVNTMLTLTANCTNSPTSYFGPAVPAPGQRA